MAAAYTNNFAGTPATTLYDIDSDSDLLLIQNPPNPGRSLAVGPLNVNATGLTGFDIAPSGMAFASLTAPARRDASLYTVNLATGAATLVGAIGGGETIRDIAVRVCTEVVYGVTADARGGTSQPHHASTPRRPAIDPLDVPITGLQAGETDPRHRLPAGDGPALRARQHEPALHDQPGDGRGDRRSARAVHARC